MVFNRNYFPKVKDFSRIGDLHAVTYTVKVVVQKKQREIDTLLLKSKVFPYSLPSVGPGADPGFRRHFMGKTLRNVCYSHVT